MNKLPKALVYSNPNFTLKLTLKCKLIFTILVFYRQATKRTTWRALLLSSENNTVFEDEVFRP